MDYQVLIQRGTLTWHWHLWDHDGNYIASGRTWTLRTAADRAVRASLYDLFERTPR